MSDKMRAFFFAIAATLMVVLARFLGVQWWSLAIGAEKDTGVTFWGCLTIAVICILLFIGRPYRAKRYLETYPILGEGLPFLRSYSGAALSYLIVFGLSFGLCLILFGTDTRNVYLSLSAALAAPLLEIPFLYGGLWKRLNDAEWNPYAASVLIAVQGAVIRLSFWRDDLTEFAKSGLVREKDSAVAFVFVLFLKVLLAFFFGILYGVLRKKYKSVLPPLLVRVLLAALFR